MPTLRTKQRSTLISLIEARIIGGLGDCKSISEIAREIAAVVELQTPLGH